MNLREQIENYLPFNEQEEKDKEYFLRFIDTFDDVLTRDNLFGHFSASAFVVNREKNKMVVVYHNINDGWIYPGGHADGESDLLSVAVREVEEETGLKANILDQNIFSIQAAPVKGHIKKGKYIPAHIHFDVVYLLEGDEQEELSYREDESQGVKWISFNDATDKSIVDFIRSTHQKLIDKIKTTL